MIPYSYELLDSTQQLILSFYAYIGGTVSDNQLLTLRKKFDLTKDRVRAATKKLHADDLLLNNYIYWWSDNQNYYINPKHYFYAINFLTEKHEDWMKIFQSVGIEQAAYCKRLFGLHKALVNNNTVAQASFKYDREILPYFLPVMMDEKYSRLILHFPEPVFEEAFIHIVLDLHETDIVDTKNLLSDLLSEKKLSPLVKMQLEDLLALYRYYSHGEYTLGNKIPNRLYTLLLAGVRSVHLGKYAEAVDLLLRALKIRNKDSKDKNLFMNFLNCFYLIMAYVHDGSPESHTKIEQFLRKKVTTERYELLPALVVAEAFTDQERKADINYINYLLTSSKYAGMNSYRWMGVLLNKYFDKKITIDAPELLPSQAVLRHELSAYLSLGDEEREWLKSRFGTAPVLTSIYRKQPWEWVIEDLLRDAQGGESVTQAVEKKTTRMMYIIRYSDNMDVREQNILKSGKWGSGKTIASYRYFAGDVECMDEIDRKILQNVLARGGYDVRLSDALPYLIGSDRVYMGNFAPFIPVTVEEEKPYLIVEKGKDGFTLNSNVSVKYLTDDKLKHIIIKKNETHYVVIPLTGKQYTYYKRLLSIGKFPLESESSLKAFLPQISQTVEVHSSLVEGEPRWIR